MKPIPESRTHTGALSIQQQATECENSLQHGFDIQAAHLAEWKSKLSPKCYEAVSKECGKRNLQLMTYHFRSGKLPTSLNVFRGQDITTFIQNYHE